MIGKSKGFTLVELLIAITLLSLVMATGTFAYLQFASRWDKELGDFQQQARLAKATAQVEQVIKGVVPYIVRNSKDKPALYFVGSKSRLLAVTNNGLATGSTEVFRLILQAEQEKFNLLYQSTPLHQIILTSTEQEIEFVNNFTLIKGLNSAALNYFGWRDLALAASKQIGAKPDWYDNYSAFERKLTPLYIQLELGSFKLLAQLDSDPTRWNGYFRKAGQF